MKSDDFKRILRNARRSFAKDAPLVFSRGLSNAQTNEKYMLVSHRGNMGHSVKNIDENLGCHAWFKSVENLKARAVEWAEEGSPDYSYTLILKLEN